MQSSGPVTTSAIIDQVKRILTTIKAPEDSDLTPAAAQLISLVDRVCLDLPMGGSNMPLGECARRMLWASEYLVERDVPRAVGLLDQVVNVLRV
jgi:hypothetical protein